MVIVKQHYVYMCSTSFAILRYGFNAFVDCVSFKLKGKITVIINDPVTFGNAHESRSTDMMRKTEICVTTVIWNSCLKITIYESGPQKCDFPDKQTLNIECWSTFFRVFK